MKVLCAITSGLSNRRPTPTGTSTVPTLTHGRLCANADIQYRNGACLQCFPASWPAPRVGNDLKERRGIRHEACILAERERQYCSVRSTATAFVAPTSFAPRRRNRDQPALEAKRRHVKTCPTWSRSPLFYFFFWNTSSLLFLVLANFKLNF